MTHYYCGERACTLGYSQYSFQGKLTRGEPYSRLSHLHCLCQWTPDEGGARQRRHFLGVVGLLIPTKGMLLQGAGIGRL